MCVWGGGGHIIEEGLGGSMGLACSVRGTHVFSASEALPWQLNPPPPLHLLPCLGQRLCEGDD